MAPFRDLLKPSTRFTWTTTHQQAFEESKQAIVNEINMGVEIFDKDRPTCLATDWSKTGIGFWLFQKHCTCPSPELFCCRTGWRITLVGSRFTHDAESRYAAIEGEALAVADALEKCRHFVLGCRNLYIAVDHKPLVKIFGDRALADISNTRLRNLKEKTLKYQFKMVYIPGVRNTTSDALSRYPTGVRTPDQMVLPDVVSAPPPRIPLTLMAGISDDTNGDEDEDDLYPQLCQSLGNASKKPPHLMMTCRHCSRSSRTDSPRRERTPQWKLKNTTSIENTYTQQMVSQSTRTASSSQLPCEKPVSEHSTQRTRASL